MSPRTRPYLLVVLSVSCTPTGAPGSAIEPESSSSSSGSPDSPTTGSPGPTSTTSGDSPSTTGDSLSTASTAGTSDEATTADTTGETTAGSLCGNGLVEPGESCDFGEDNSDLGYCKTDCTHATCGDGKIWVGVEACDDGSNDGAYGGCLADCSALGPFCGDGLLHPSEGCDAAEANGSGEHADGFVPCSALCDLEALRVYVSSVPVTGKIGGLAGADEFCEDLAEAAGWPLDTTLVRAWLSDGSTSALSRLQEFMPGKPFALVNGKRIADSLEALVTDGPGDGIDIDELGVKRTEVRVWTNTGVAGEAFSATDHCYGWASESFSHLALVGLNAVPKLPEAEWNFWSGQKQWTKYMFKSCSQGLHLYCFELDL
jgi:hypothetical protein